MFTIGYDDGWMPLFRRRNPLLIDDSEHKAAKRQAHEQAAFHIRLVGL